MAGVPTMVAKIRSDALLGWGSGVNHPEDKRHHQRSGYRCAGVTGGRSELVFGGWRAAPILPRRHAGHTRKCSAEICRIAISKQDSDLRDRVPCILQ